MIAAPPGLQWVQDAVFYQIFPDRFARGSTMPTLGSFEPWDTPPTEYGFKGGDLLGVIERLDAIQDLGATVLYFTPVFQSAANHRYHTHDYYQVDPLLGGNAALRQLLDAAHHRGIRVVLDGVFNHASRGFFPFHHILENGPDSPFRDWFTIHTWPLNPYPLKRIARARGAAIAAAPRIDPAITPADRPEPEFCFEYDRDQPAGYSAWWNLHALPKFNTAHPPVREFLWGVGRHWIEQGIDGWRLDVPHEINDDSFWEEFRQRIKAANPAAYIVGEIWGDARRWLQGDQFDGVMNYLFTKACIGFFAGPSIETRLVEGKSYWPIAPLDAAQFDRAIQALLALYRPEVTAVLLNLLDSHDTARFLSIAGGDETALRLATLFQMTYPGAPMVYYGDEIGLEGGLDADSRRTYPRDERRWNHALRDYFRRLIALRRAHPSLRRGDFTTLATEGGVYVFARRSADEVAVVAINTEAEDRTLTIPLAGQAPDGMALHRQLSPETVQAVHGSLNGAALLGRSGDVWIGTL